MRYRVAYDVSHLPTSALGPKAVTWWGILLMVLIEATLIVLLFACYFYLRQNFTAWPPADTLLPDLGYGTANLIVILLSLPVMIWIDQLALHEGDKRTILIALLIYFVLAGISIWLRFEEFPATRTRWDEHAYGSIVWWILGTHLVHIVGSTVETLVLAAYLLVHKLDTKRRLDLNVDCIYWYFVIGAEIPLYVIVYLVPRWW